MKKSLTVLLLTITVCSKNSKAQHSGALDTVAYLQTIVDNRNFYIGKPFSVLIDSLKIPIQYFSPFTGIHYDRSREAATFFSFYFPKTWREKHLTYPKLEITWEDPFNSKLTTALYDYNNGGGWSPLIAEIYAEGIIANIKIRTKVQTKMKRHGRRDYKRKKSPPSHKSHTGDFGGSNNVSS
jgi:hypothetical protein